MINNYRAFYGQYQISLNGKNALIYGENGSGKSSLYYGLKDLFNSSTQEVILNENIFIETSQKDSVTIEVGFFDKSDKSKTSHIKIDRSNKATTDILVANANKIKAFFDYKKLLATHFIDKEKVDIFDILINDILYYSINNFTTNTFGEEWNKINELKNARKNSAEDIECKEILKNFNLGLKEKLSTIKDKANTFIDYFGYGIKIDFEFKDIEIYRKDVRYNEIILKIEFFDKHIDKHHTFFNEARLTALGISLYLSSILSNPLDIDFKIMFLDDVLIGLDMSNRIPFIDILKDHFDKFQLFITTYDKTWYELLKSYLSSNDWEYLEIYSKKLGNNFEIPIIYQDDLITKARTHFDNNDYKASAVYIRSAFEKILKDYCHKKHLKVKFNKQPFKVDSNAFWEAIVESTTLSQSTKDEIELYRGIVMNPISHYTIEKPEFKSEIEKSIDIVKNLRDELKNINYIKPLNKLKEENQKLKDNIKSLEITGSIANKEFDFTKDVLDKLIEINSTIALNTFLKNLDFKDISTLELDNIFTELRFSQKLELFDLDIDATLVRIFMKREWSSEEKKVWCNFIKYLDGKNIIKDRFLINKLEEEKCLIVHYDNYGEEYRIDCSFLDEIISPLPPYIKPPSSKISNIPEIDINEDEVPF